MDEKRRPTPRRWWTPTPVSLHRTNPLTLSVVSPQRELLVAAMVLFLLLASPAPARCRKGVDGDEAALSGRSVQPRSVQRSVPFQHVFRALKSPAERAVASSPSAYLDFRSRRRKRRKRVKEDPPPTEEKRTFFANLTSSSPQPPSFWSGNGANNKRVVVSSHRRKVRSKSRKIKMVCRKSPGYDSHRCFESGVGSRRVAKGPRDRRWWRRRKGRGRKKGTNDGKREKDRGRRRGKKGGRKAGGGERGGSAGGRHRPFHVAKSSRRRVVPGGSSRYSNARLYGRWSRWSPCSRSCTTQRFRWCKRPLHCGSDVVREEAYCYVEGSFCHRWIHRQIQQQPDTEDNEAGIDPSSDELDLKPVYNGTPMASGDVWSHNGCGISPGNNHTSVVAVRRHQQALRIIGGRESTPGRWPWQVAVLNRFKEAFCGGTLVAPHWILTAAHCVRKRLYVRLGEHDLVEEDGTEAEFRVEEAIIHPDYDADTVDNDVALLRLPMWASSGRGDGLGHGLACLPRPRQALPLRRLCTIIGWGKRKSSDAFGTDILHEAEVPIVSNEICRDVYEEYYITGNMFCAGYRKGRMDSCAGDSGGPLLCLSGRGTDGSNRKWTIFGITSFGEGCGKRGKYGIYTKVSNYVRWVQRVVNGFYGNGRK
ncbi:uncharacterized protein [Hetaerina americana]|uniref:uncharacterized protein n=1 Tax=Hetaerina americana TaxID=62018 RepID=UPI003A7F59E4